MNYCKLPKLPNGTVWAFVSPESIGAANKFEAKGGLALSPKSLINWLPLSSADFTGKVRLKFISKDRGESYTNFIK